MQIRRSLFDVKVSLIVDPATHTLIKKGEVYSAVKVFLFLYGYYLYVMYVVNGRTNLLTYVDCLQFSFIPICPYIF